MALKIVPLPERSDAEEEQMLALEYAMHAPLRALGLSEPNERQAADPSWDGTWENAEERWAPQAAEQDGICRWWATHPDVEELVPDGIPRLSWVSDSGNIHVLAVVSIPTPRPWILALTVRREANGSWTRSSNPNPSGYYWKWRGEQSACEPVPLAEIASACAEYEVLVKRFAETMHLVAFADASRLGDDDAFGTAWSVWHQDGRGKGARTNDQLVALAVRYLARAATGDRNPTSLLADDLGKEPIAVNKALAAARRRGLLSPAPRGRAGGSLTREGMLVLEQLVRPYLRSPRRHDISGCAADR